MTEAGRKRYIDEVYKVLFGLASRSITKEEYVAALEEIKDNIHMSIEAAQQEIDNEKL